MSTVTAFEVSLYLATYLSSVCFGFVLLFVVVIMPGLSELDDGAFLRGFQVIDGVVQRMQPVFVFVWIGSPLAIIVSAALGLVELDDSLDRALLVVCAVVNLVGQITTFTINVPMNNRVQSLTNVGAMEGFAKRSERERFEGPWNFWNQFRTVLFGAVSAYLVYLCLKQ